jgi:hypothetical protein
MEFSGALRLIRSSNARLTCLAVEVRHKATFPLKPDTCLLPLLSNPIPPCIPSQKTTTREANRTPSDLDQLCNWEQHRRSKMPKLDSEFLRGMK